MSTKMKLVKVRSGTAPSAFSGPIVKIEEGIAPLTSDELNQLKGGFGSVATSGGISPMGNNFVCPSNGNCGQDGNGFCSNNNCAESCGACAGGTKAP